MLHGSNDKKQGTSFCSTGRAMAYGYDAIGHLTQVDAASSPSDAARYRYDAAGNPVDRAELGLDVTNSFNNLNQIVSGVWTGSTLTVAGTVNHPAGNIAVNGVGGTIYPDGSFSVANVPVALGTNTLTATYTGPAYTNAPMTATDTVSVVLANAAYTHDANGNLTGDATFAYQYDTANQLTNVIRKADNARVLSCRYDALGRRVEAIRSDGTVDRYVYFPGSFLVLAVLDETNAPKELYTRGPDLSGSLDTAGGIGGILACTYSNAPTAPLYHHADLMGNVIALSDFSATLVSTFRYAPCGQLASCKGSLARHLFATKEWEAGTGLLYYGYRYYSTQLARWLQRDPAFEDASINLYCFVDNDGINTVDFLGNVTVKKHLLRTRDRVPSNPPGKIWWGVTFYPKASILREAKLKCNLSRKLCEVIRKPEVLVEIHIIIQESGKQNWQIQRGTGRYKRVYPVYVHREIVSLAYEHEMSRFNAWAEAAKEYWADHYEDVVAQLTAPTCEELEQTIESIWDEAPKNWESSEEASRAIEKQMIIARDPIYTIPIEKTNWRNEPYIEFRLEPKRTKVRW